MHIILSPLGFGLLLALLLALRWRRLSRALRILGLLLEFAAIALTTPLGANALVWQIESRVPTNAACNAPEPSTIVVLANGFARAPEHDTDFAALETDSVRRILAAVDLWRSHPQATLVIAGGGPFAISESAVLQRFAERLGVPAASMRREERSQNTWENAEQLRAFAPALPERVWLVSSALHLPRADIAFRAHGFSPCLIASDRKYLPPGGIGYYLPQSSALVKTEQALHELFGAAAYRWRAWNLSR